MCNLYRLSKGPAEIARLFAAQADPPGNAGDTVYPGYPGYVLAEGRVPQMVWGFPLALKGKNGQLLKPKPVTARRRPPALRALPRQHDRPPHDGPVDQAIASIFCCLTGVCGTSMT
jgi:hypothetical protein